MSFEYIDTHSHVAFPQFDADREAVLARMREKGVHTIAVGVDFKTSRAAVALAQLHRDVVVGATIGVHPTDSNEGFEPEHYAGLFATHGGSTARKVVVGVGECGFDYFRTPKEEVFERQKQIFRAQIAFAVEYDLPLMLHVRPSKGSDDAHIDALELLEDAKRIHGEKVRGNAHFFTGSLTMARRYWDLGFTIAFPGVITFAKECERLVKEAPIDMILSETDAPYAAPVPHRGERNEPVFVIDTVAAIAAIRGESLEIVKKRLVANAFRVFKVA